ncbi:hypothetical protein [Chelatococcus reniformis]|nr:hypothetical protein [Chelatococcus reniformis]
MRRFAGRRTLLDALRRAAQRLRRRPLGTPKPVVVAARQPDPAAMLFDAPIGQAIGHAGSLLTEFETTREVSFPIVYRLETAYAAFDRAIAASSVDIYGQRRARLRDALLQVVHLAQVAREWQQDIYNLRQGPYHDEPQPENEAALEAGIAHLRQFIRQNMADLASWLSAAERLRGE